MLLYLLFAIWEVPQSSTGFSPYELLDVQQPQGILDLLQESWQEQGITSQKVTQYGLKKNERERDWIW